MAQFDFNALRQALETRDADLLISLYADDADIQIVNRNTPPGRPFEIAGKLDIETHLLDVCGRDMSHHVTDEVIADDRVSYIERCSYSDGTKVLAANILGIDDGKITSQISVETWDE